MSAGSVLAKSITSRPLRSSYADVCQCGRGCRMLLDEGVPADAACGKSNGVGAVVRQTLRPSTIIFMVHRAPHAPITSIEHRPCQWLNTLETCRSARDRCAQWLLARIHGRRPPKLVTRSDIPGPDSALLSVVGVRAGRVVLDWGCSDGPAGFEGAPIRAMRTAGKPSAQAPADFPHLKTLFMWPHSAL